LEEENEASLTVNLEKQKQQYDRALQSLESAAEKMHTVYEKMIVEHRQAIAKLAVEIARKILAQKVKDGDYQIESIIQEALNNAPAHQDVVVRLNPADYARCQQMPKSDGALASVKLIADSKIGAAECVIETPRGKVESLIDDHLEHVARALSKAV
jgi:flagellar biosynthesis/type III secretory pathway protein FliH